MAFVKPARTSNFLAALTVGSVALCAVGLLVIDFAARASNADIDHRTLIAVASAAAAAVDVKDIGELDAASPEVSASAARRVQAKLRRLGDVYSGIHFLYLISHDKTRLYFPAEAQNANPSSGSLSEHVFPGALDAAGQVFETGQARFVQSTPEKSGKWIAGLAPVRTSDGRVIAVIGFDMPAGAWRAALGPDRHLVQIFISMGATVVFLAGLGLAARLLLYGGISAGKGKVESDLAELSLANRIVENSSTVLFRLRPGELPPKLAYLSRNIARYGYCTEEMINDPAHWFGLFHEEDQAEMIADVDAITSGKIAEANRELRFKSSNGERVWFRGELRGVRDDGGKLVALEGTLVDITQTKYAEERIAHLTNHDPLTGLANRGAFVDRLKAAFTKARVGGPGFAVLHLDVDHFKDLNDAFGHERGDLLLLEIGERLRNCVRESDMVGRFVVARFGGDEYAVLQSDVSEPSDTAILAKRLGDVMSAPITIDGQEIHLTVSIGISLYAPEIGQPTEMLTKADLALQRAKSGGRNQFCFHSRELEVDVGERVAIGEQLRAALQNKELELYYQPQVDGATGEIVGLEGLMRWNCSGHGYVPPETFIHVAERTGLIAQLGQYALDTACAQIRLWLEQGIDPPIVAVNVSALQLRNADEFMRSLSQAMRRSKIRADHLELELTETLLAEVSEASSNLLHGIRDLGVRIAVDDFGTGYSSLQYLSSYPINRIKIAQQFVRNVTVGSDDAAIVNATISLARALRLEVIAEGVETAEQLAFLMAHGCRMVQGYYFSQPLPASLVGELLKKGRFDLDTESRAQPPAVTRPLQNRT